MRIKQGAVLFYHSFDVGGEILLDKVEKLLGTVPKTSPLELKKISPKYVQYRRPPLLISLGSEKIGIGNRIVEAKVSAKLYDFGVVTVIHRVPFSGELRELRELSAGVWDALPALEEAAFSRVGKIKAELGPLVINPSRELFSEDYVIYHVNRFDRPAGAGELAKKYADDIACMLAFEPGGLSEQKTKSILKNSVSYSNDLVVAGWNAAFVYDTEECYDTFDVLEYANMELLELRWYDRVLDAGLDGAYDDLRKPGPILGSKYSRISAGLFELGLDVSEVMERVDNSLKLVGEPYLAGVHESAASAFHLKEWRDGVDRKLGLVKDIYTVLNHELETTRLIILEVLVIVLIAAEIVLALV